MYSAYACGFYLVSWLRSVWAQLSDLFILFYSYHFSLVFHLSHRLTKKFPENCLLIILGIIVGVLLYVTHLDEEKRIYVVNNDIFFLFLLPPIVLETGYFLPKRAFFDNLGTILLLAVLNKLFNTMCIGLTIWAFGKTVLLGSTTFSLLECFLFASFITAVDPIAVLATFVEIRVNDTLYIVVFGESLLNDAVSIVSRRFAEETLMNIFFSRCSIVCLKVFLELVKKILSPKISYWVSYHFLSLPSVES